MATRSELWRLSARAAGCLAALILTSLTEAAQEAPVIPLEVGLVVVSATHDRGQDYEVFRTVTAADDANVTFELHRKDPSEDGKDREAISVVRVVDRQDLASANRLVVSFHSEDPQAFPGSTATQVSTDFLGAVKSGAETPFVFGTAAGPMGAFGERKYYRGTLKRVEPTSVPVFVLLNGVRTALPAIHAVGTLKVGDDVAQSEFWWLDQPDNPLTLRWTFKDSNVQVVRIDTPPPKLQPESNPLTVALASDLCRVELHGVYFDSGSAVLLPQSEAEIANVAALMNAQPTWRLTIEGHTDDIGTADYNQTLSQHRAEAVRLALVDGHKIVADRLTATGFGKTRPVDTNTTIEGRAHNRRVELARKCP